MTSSDGLLQSLRKLDDLVQDVADITGLSIAQIKTQIRALTVETYDFQGMVLIPASATDVLIDQWAEQLKMQLRTGENPAGSPPPTKKKGRSPKQKTQTAAGKTSGKKTTRRGRKPSTEEAAQPAAQGKSSPSKAPEATLDTSGTKKSAPKEAADQPDTKATAATKKKGKTEKTADSARKTAKTGNTSSVKAPSNPADSSESEPSKQMKRRKTKKKQPSTADAAAVQSVPSELKLPRGFGKTVSNQYEPTLDRLLPKAADQRRLYLKAILDETAGGKEFLTRIVRAIQKKYKGRPDRTTAYKGLLEKANNILDQMSTSAVPE